MEKSYVKRILFLRLVIKNFANGGASMKYTIMLYIAICMMQIIILANITIAKGAYNGLAMWLCTAVFVFASTIFGLSRQRKNTQK